MSRSFLGGLQGLVTVPTSWTGDRGPHDGVGCGRLFPAFEPPGGDGGADPRPPRSRRGGTSPRCRLRRRQDHGADRRARATRFGARGRPVAGYDRLRVGPLRLPRSDRTSASRSPTPAACPTGASSTSSSPSTPCTGCPSRRTPSARSAPRCDPGAGRSCDFVPQGERTSLEDVIEDVRESAGWADYLRGIRTTLHASHPRGLSRPGRAERSPRGRHPRPG